MNVKKVVRKFVNKFGYDIRQIAHGPSKTRTTMAESYSLLHGMGFRPKIVVDVGVAKGTIELYTVFPDAFFVLIEPLKEFEPDLKSILKKYKGLYVLAAAGATSGQVIFNVHNNHLEGSSLYKETMGIEADGCEITIPLIRIDDFLKESELNAPELIKIDVQGAELEALEGAQKTLLEAEVVVLEVSLFEFMKGAPQLFDVVFYMKNHGFVAYDIIHGWNRPLDNALGQIDVVFVKENGRFRQDHAYSKS